MLLRPHRGVAFLVWIAMTGSALLGSDGKRDVAPQKSPGIKFGSRRAQSQTTATRQVGQ